MTAPRHPVDPEIAERARYAGLLDALRDLGVTPTAEERASLRNLAAFWPMSAHVTDLINRAAEQHG